MSGQPPTTVSTIVTGLDVTELSAQIRPQDDLYRHVNGAWLDRTQIPQDQAASGTFPQLRDESEARVRSILEEAAAGDAPAGSEERKLGDLYADFLDEQAVASLGSGPIEADLRRIAALDDLTGLIETLSVLHSCGVPGAFAWYVDTDARASDRYVVHLYQGGLGLPDESYYRQDDFEQIRQEYLGHVTRMLTLVQVPDPGRTARRAIELEHALAAAHWDRVASRDATRVYNKLDRAALTALTGTFDWSSWLVAHRAPDGVLDDVVVAQPSYLEAFGRTLTERPLEDWKAWLTWKVVHSAAPYLSQEFVEENFSFYGRTLSGTPQLRERWKRAVSTVEGALGEAVGRVFVQRYFPPTAKERMLELVEHLLQAYRERITALDWMSPRTKSLALEKLDRFTPKIGYPDRWRDYSALRIERGDLIGNLRRAVAFELEHELNKLGRPVDRSEWFMTPQTVNAYYNPGMNEIVFPAAILQPPFFDADADDAVNFGAIGAVIGHEIGHGFDDQGSKYDGEGNLRDWWTERDRARFEERTAALIKQFEVLEPEQTPGHRVNGALTVGENIGDLGGLSIAQVAYQISLAGRPAPVLDGLTATQRLFLGWAQVWRTNIRDAELIRRLAIDPHSPSEFRCNAVVRNIDAFHEAFGVVEGDALWLDPAERVRIW